MHPFSGPALWSPKKRAGCLFFIVFYVSCLCSVLWLVWVRRTTAGIQRDIYATAGGCARRRHFTPFKVTKYFPTNRRKTLSFC